MDGEGPEMTEPTVEEIVARLDRELDLRGQATLAAPQFRALIASWRALGQSASSARAKALEEALGIVRAHFGHKGRGDACARSMAKALRALAEKGST